MLAVSLSLLARNEYQSLAGLLPHAVEKEFGKKDNEFKLELLSQPGRTLYLNGRVDRIDLGAGQIRITDYKHSTNKANLSKMAKPELFGRSAFQLPIYLAAARNLLGGDYAGQHLTARILPTILLSMRPPGAEMERMTFFSPKQLKSGPKPCKAAKSICSTPSKPCGPAFCRATSAPTPRRKIAGIAISGGFAGPSRRPARRGQGRPTRERSPERNQEAGR